MRHNSIRLTICIALLIPAASTAKAVPVFDTSISSQLGDADGVITEFPLSGPIANFSNEISVGDPNSAVNGSAKVEVGSSIKSVKARASVSGGSASLFSASALVQTEYRDIFVMTAIDANGSPVPAGTFVANAVISGEATASGGGFFSAFASASGGMTINGSLGDSFRVVATASGSSTNSPRAESRGVNVVVPWFFGQPITLRMFAVADVLGSSGNRSPPIPGFFSAKGDIFSTIEWTGISDVLDSDGNPVAEFTALNDVGDDYATGVTVPEPTTLALIAIALAVLGAMLRRQ